MVGWALIVIAGIANIFLVGEVIYSFTLSGAAAAQADLGAFMLWLGIGSVVFAISILVLLVGFLLNVKMKINASILKNPIVVGCLINMAIPVLVGIYFFGLLR